MTEHSTSPVVLTFTRYFARPTCPACGEEQIVPELSEFVAAGVIRHTYSCDDCGYEFCTVVEFGCDAA